MRKKAFFPLLAPRLPLPAPKVSKSIELPGCSGTGRSGTGAAFGAGVFAGFLFVQTLGDFFGVSLLVEFQQAVEDFAAGGFADRVAGALLGGVEAVA